MNKILQTTLCGVSAASLALAPINVYAMSQDETVYAKLQPTGTQSYISVTKHLLNNSSNSQLLDKTILNNIENINGFESYTLTNNQLTWNANGADIYYRGETTNELPVTLEATYKLNDVEKPLEEILGQSGKIEIVLHYHNSSKVGDLYTPFVVAMATTLPENGVHNVSVTNGKIVSNGRRLAVTAVAAPGLYESLHLEEIKDLDKITLTFEAEKFELSDIYSMVTPKLIDESDLKVFSEVDKLSSNTQKLSDSSKELVKGSNNLRNGIQELHNALIQTQQQFENAGDLLDDNKLNQISDTAAQTANRKITTMQSSIDRQVSRQVDTMMAGLNLSFSEAEQQTLAQNIIAQVCKTNTQPVAPSESDTDTMANEDNTNNVAVVDAVCAQHVMVTLSGVMQSLPSLVNKKVSALTPTIKNTLSTSIYEQIEDAVVKTASTTARNVASQVAESIQTGLNSKINSLLSETLKGVDKLLDGANQLNGGMQKFDTDGIQQLNNVVNGKIKTTSDRVKRLTKLADDYNNFSGIADGVDGETKFILMIDGRKS